MNRSEKLLVECGKLWAPPPKQKLSEWAEENFKLSAEYSAHTGKLRLYRFQREILDAFTDPYTREIVVMSATQLVKTLLQQVAIAYVIARAPGPILAAQPTETDAETFSKERLSPMIRDMECLRDRVSPERKTSKANTTLHKVFPGGSLSLIGAQTAGNFARRSIRYFFADERDKWPKVVGKEGDGFSLGKKRQATFRSIAKTIQTCSPTIEGNSAIAAAYAESDMRRFWVQCPYCNESQVLRWGRVVWDAARPAATARYQCESCESAWTDVERWAACELGEWRGDKEFRGTAGFWISELYSPWKRLGDLVVDFLAKKDDPALFQTFVNTSLAETWKEQGEAPDHEKLMSRREEYSLGEVPDGVAVLTAGVDVQKTWIQGHVWGWGPHRQRWLVDRFVIEGSPFLEPTWEKLTEYLNAQYRRGGTVLNIARMAVDTGFATQEAYQWARENGSRAMAVDGRQNGVSLVASPSQVDITIGGRKIKHGCKLFPVNVSMAKSELYGLLAKERPADGEPYPAGWIHFPRDVDQDFFKQLTAEHLVTHIVKGYRKTEWQKTGPNHDLDCCNYARAAAFVFGVDRFGERRWSQLMGSVDVAPIAATENQAVADPVRQPTTSPTPPRPTPARQSPSNWMRSFMG